MSDLDDSFAKLLGTQPTDKDRQNLYRVRDALGLKSNDALWLVLMALQHYQSQYEAFPARIEDAARRTMHRFEHAADAQAKAAAESARQQVTDAATRAAWDLVRKVETRERLKWISIAIATCILCLATFAVLMHTMGKDEGKAIGYASGYEAAKDERAAASWAATAEGKAAYRLAKAGSILQLAECAGPGWYVDDGACYPARAADGVYGWRIQSRSAR